MANEEAGQRTIPPYLAFRTFQNFIEGLRVGIPARIDRSVLPSLSGAVQSWLLGALRYLGLITPHGVAGDKLGKLVNAQGLERQKVLREIVTEAYSFLFKDGLDLKTATPRQIEERFTEAGASGETVRKCIAFFIAMAKAADLPLSPYLTKARGGRATGQRSRRAPGPIIGKSLTHDEERPEGEVTITSYQMLIGILDPNTMEKEEQDAVWTLICYLRRRETAGSEQQ